MRGTCRFLALALILWAAFAKAGRAQTVQFGAATSYPVGTNPVAVLSGDFNGDAKPDIAVLNAGSNNVSVLLGNGDGTFQPAINSDVGNSMINIAAADFNGDGKLDLAVFLPGNAASAIPGEVRILLGSGDGSFKPPVVTMLSATDVVMRVGDFNDDQKADLIFSNLDPTTQAITFEIRLGNGDGTFQQPGGFLPPNLSGTDFAVADFNNDGNPDLVFSAGDGAQIHLNRGTEGFAPGPGQTAEDTFSFEVSSVSTADINGDGKPDLLVNSSAPHGGADPGIAQQIGIFLGNGDGTFGGEQIPLAGSSGHDEFNFGGSNLITGVWLGDFNGDGFADILDLREVTCNPPTCKAGTFVELNLGKGDGSFTSIASPIGQPVPDAFHDLNGDHLDDAISIGTNAIEVALNTSPLPPDFTVNPSTKSLRLKRGGQVGESLWLPARGAFSETIVLTCVVAGASPMPACTVSPSSVIPGSTATLTVSASVPTVSVPTPHFSVRLFASFLPFGLVGCVLVAAVGDSRRTWFLWILLTVVIILPTGCGSAIGVGPSPPTTESYTVTVTATSGSLQHSTTVNVTLD